MNSKDNVVTTLELTAEGSGCIISSLTLIRTGTAVDADTEDIRLYCDNTQLAVGQFVDGKVSFNLAEPVTIEKDETAKLNVKLDVSANAKKGHVIGVKLEGTGDITTDSDIPVIINSEINLRYIGEVSERIVIDGAFDDWKDISSYLDNDQDSVKNKNIDMNEYRLAYSEGDLSLYFEVEGTMMGGTTVPVKPEFVEKSSIESVTHSQITPEIIDEKDINAISQEIREKIPLPQVLGEDSAYIFLDTDQNPTTGCYLEAHNIGADYLIQITGKNGRILESNCYIFDTGELGGLITVGGTQNNNWQYITNVPVGIDSRRLETTIDLSNLGVQHPGQNCMKLFFYIKAWNDEKDTIKAPFEIQGLKPIPKQLIIKTGGSYIPAGKVQSLNQVSGLSNYEYGLEGDLYSTYFKHAFKPHYGDGIKFCINDTELSFQGNELAYQIENEKFSISKLNDTIARFEDHRIIYENIFPDIDLEYSHYQTQLKENLILYTQPILPNILRPAINSLTFNFASIFNYSNNIEMWCNGEKLKSSEMTISEVIEFRNVETQELMFYLEKPYAIDSNGACINLQYELEVGTGQNVLHLKTPYNWLLDPTRVYPVKIDPTIKIQPDATEGNDSFIMAGGGANTNYGTASDLRIIAGAANTIKRSLILFNLSSVPTNADLISATLYLYFYTDGFSPPDSSSVDVHRITNSWTESGVTYNSRDGTNDWVTAGGDFQPTPEANATLNIENYGWVTWEITNLTQNWVNSTYQNYGIILKQPDDDSVDGINPSFYSSDYTGDSNLTPKLVIEYNRVPNAPTNLLCEGQTNPVGVSDFTPDFSWTFSDPDVEDVSDGYEIEVGSDNDWAVVELWDPAPVLGSNATGCAYAGPALSPSTTYYWRVRSKDNTNATAAWGTAWAYGQFTMAANAAPTISDPVPPQPPTTVEKSKIVKIGCTFTDSNNVNGNTICYRYDKNGNGVYDSGEGGGDANGWIQKIYSTAGSINCNATVTFDVDGERIRFEWKANDTLGATAYSGTADDEGISDDWYLIINSNGLAQITSGSSSGTNDEFGFSVAYGQLNNDVYDDVIVGVPGANKVYIFYGSGLMNSYTLSPINANVTFSESAADFGWSISSADVDNNGYDDMIVGAPSYNNSKGRVFIYLTQAGGGFGDTIADLNIIGGTVNGKFGYSVSSAGNFDNDANGYEDVIIGAPGDNKAYIYYGGNPMDGGTTPYLIDALEGVTTAWTVGSGDLWELGDPTVPNISPYSGANCWETDLDGSLTVPGPWVLYSPTLDLSEATSPYLYYYEYHVTGGGDTAEVYLYYDGSWEATPIDSVSGTSSGWAQRSVSLSSALGYDDVKIKLEASETGANSNLDWAIDDVIVNESLGGPDLILYGEDIGDDFGWSVAYAGDIDNDTKHDDVIVGAPNYNPTDVGRVYIYNGSATPDNTVDFILTGKKAGQNFGWSVASAGNVSGKNDSIIIGSPGLNNGQGMVCICHGGASLGIDVKLAGANVGDRFGYSVSSAGDLNNDGTYDDVIIGAPYNDATGVDAGAIYVFYGSSSMTDTSASNADNISYGKSTGEHFGWSVSRAGDVNNDGWNDAIIGAPGFDNNTYVDAGKAYVMTYYEATVIPEFGIIVIPIFITLIIIAIFRRKYCGKWFNGSKNSPTSCNNCYIRMI